MSDKKPNQNDADGPAAKKTRKGPVLKDVDQPQAQEPQRSGPVLKDIQQTKAPNPALFLIIIALVILFGLFVGSRRTDTVIVNTDREAVLNESRRQQEQNREELEMNDIPMLDIIKQTAPLPDRSGN